MAWVAIDKDGTEAVFPDFPHIGKDIWEDDGGNCFELRRGSISNLIGRKLTWLDEPVELKEKEHERS